MKTLNSYRIICLLCLIVPFLTINLCLFVYKISSNYNVYPNLDWSKDIITINNFNKLPSSTFTNCPEQVIQLITYHYRDGSKTGLGHFDIKVFLDKVKNNNLNKIQIKIDKKRENTECIKKFNLVNSLFIQFPYIEQKIVNSNINNSSGYANVKNPYIYGEISISRAARTMFNANYIFKPFLIITSILLILYWRRNYFFIKNLTSHKVKNYFYVFGVFSALFLSLHALGIDANNTSSKLIENIRRLILILFIVTEILAQFYFSLKIYQNRFILKKYLNNNVVILKIIFVIFFLSFTVLTLIFLALTKYEGNLINIIEWGYFNLLLFYYLLSAFLWKEYKKN